jgi:hypothetical protein
VDCARIPHADLFLGYFPEIDKICLTKRRLRLIFREIFPKIENANAGLSAFLNQRSASS